MVHGVDAAAIFISAHVMDVSDYIAVLSHLYRCFYARSSSSLVPDLQNCIAYAGPYFVRSNERIGPKLICLCPLGGERLSFVHLSINGTLYIL